MTPKEKLRRAFDTVYDRFPYLATCAATWKVVERPFPADSAGDFPFYAATDGPTLYVNPLFLETLNIAECTDLVLHELGHVFLGHMFRFPFDKNTSPLEHRELNIALDLALNDTMSEHYDQTVGSKIVEIAIFPGRIHSSPHWCNNFVNMPKGKDAEFYLDLVRKSRPPQVPMPKAGSGGQGQPQQGQPQSNQGGQGKGTDGQQNAPGQGSQGASVARSGQQSSTGGNGSGDKPEAGSQPSGGAGSEKDNISESQAADASSNAQNERQDMPPSIGDVLPHPVMASDDPQEVEEAKQEWQQKIAQGINNAKQCGNLPGWIEELSKELYGSKSKQDWRAILRRFMTVIVSGGGQSFARPNRRQSYRQDVIMPAKRSRQASKGCILVDTSGSMSKAQCDMALSEIEAILNTFPRCEVDLVMADTRLIDTTLKHFHRYDFPLRLPTQWVGRGGTNLNQPILGVAENRTYKWLVVVSDMIWAADQAVNPKIPTIFLWTPDNMDAQLYSRPKFGTLIGPLEVPKGH